MGGKRLQKKRTTSQIIALGILLIDGAATFAVLAICSLAIVCQYTGALPYLTALIGALQAVTGVVLERYFKKSGKENSSGGIVYDMAMKAAVSDSDTGDL